MPAQNKIIYIMALCKSVAEQSKSAYQTKKLLKTSVFIQFTGEKKMKPLAIAGIAIVAVVLVLIVGQTTGMFALFGNSPNPNPNPNPNTGEIKTFVKAGNAAVCTENSKPVIRLFSTTWCSHCVWIKDTFDSTMKEQIAEGKIVAYHWDLDTGDNTLPPEIETKVPDSELAIYNQFNPSNSIPTFVFGCEYSRVGNGYEAQKDLASEKAEFIAVINELLKQ